MSRADPRGCRGSSSAEDALAKLSDKASDLCLIDFFLPVVNGIKLSRTYPDTRCLMVSSHYEQFYFDAALMAGTLASCLKVSPTCCCMRLPSVLRGEIVV